MVYCTDPLIGVQWAESGKSLVLRMVAPEGPTSKVGIFFLVIYDLHDKSLTQKPLAVHRVEMHGVFVERVPARVGIVFDFLVSVPSSAVKMANPCTARCWSSVPQLVMPSAEMLKLLPGGSFSLPVRVLSSVSGSQSCPLHIVSNEAPELLAPILVFIDATMPSV